MLVGHGYGSYLSYRAALLPLPEGLEYDYGGSLWLELIFEIGLVATLLMVFLVSRLVFARISVLTIVAVGLLGSIGVKHDVQMLSGFLAAQLIAQSLAQARRAKRTGLPS